MMKRCDRWEEDYDDTKVGTEEKQNGNTFMSWCVLANCNMFSCALLFALHL